MQVFIRYFHFNIPVKLQLLYIITSKIDLSLSQDVVDLVLLYTSSARSLQSTVVQLDLLSLMTLASRLPWTEACRLCLNYITYFYNAPVEQITTEGY